MTAVKPPKRCRTAAPPMIAARIASHLPSTLGSSRRAGAIHRHPLSRSRHRDARIQRHRTERCRPCDHPCRTKSPRLAVGRQGGRHRHPALGAPRHRPHGQHQRSLMASRLAKRRSAPPSPALRSPPWPTPLHAASPLRRQTPIISTMPPDRCSSQRSRTRPAHRWCSHSFAWPSPKRLSSSSRPSPMIGPPRRLLPTARLSQRSQAAMNKRHAAPPCHLGRRFDQVPRPA